MDGRTWYRGKTVVISGASGFIGGSLAKCLASASAKVVRLSRKPLAPMEGCCDHTGDYVDPDLWRRALPGADTVFHLAAQTSFYTAAQDPDADFRANVVPLRTLLELARREGLKPFIVFAGSITQVGLTSRVPLNESLQDSPITIYDLHKLLSETYLRAYACQGLAWGTTLRLTNVYGPGPKRSASDRGVLNAMVARALRGETLTVYGSGKVLRDYLYIDDMVAALLAAGRGGEGLNGRYFVTGSGRGMTLLDSFRLIADRVTAKTGLRAAVVTVPEPPGLSPIEGRNSVVDASAFRNATGWQPKVGLEEGIDRSIEHALAAAGGRHA